MPLANSFLEEYQLREHEPRYPLEVVWCESCGLLQINEIVSPDILFKDYIYVSGTSETLRQHFEELARNVAENYGLGTGTLVVDIGSNDGTLLKEFKKIGSTVIGVEPAVNIAKVAEANGIKTINDFFSYPIAMKMVKEYGKAKAITATNVVAHTNDLDDLLKAVSNILMDDGVFVIEVPYLIDLLENTEFDTIYHEHLSYFAIHPLKKIIEEHGLKIVNVERVKIHGGSIRVFICKKESRFCINKNLEGLTSIEFDKELHKPLIYRKFAGQVEKLKEDLVGLLNELKKKNKKIVGYGAAAKGNTLLNYYQIGTDLLDYIADLSPLKQNRYTPGTHIPIFGPDKIYETKPDYILILAWNFADEIMKQQSRFKEGGGKFIIPVPEVRII
jgi:SAM-dependent methyltransferase